ncbi:glycosyltransferase [Ferrovibrio sp.]|uniref:glycosyltransferase n=1 Tax=Ferrovibrio sp. TaxID=1917215 RepID=UPI002612CB31|nr:glycosyltransferase [Ferrovibrio sp.]
MMAGKTTVHILTPGFSTPNGRAFLYPLVRFRTAIENYGVHIRFFASIAPELGDCDTLIFDSKFFRNAWGAEKQRTMDLFASFREKTGRFFFFDIGDSASWLIDGALPSVDAYFKSQLLRDRSLYARPLYGRRLYTDFYHSTAGVTDDNPVGSEAQVRDTALLSKLRVSWNSGLADYSLAGPFRMALYNHLPLASLLRAPGGWARPDAARSIPVSCRMGISYERATVRWQRERIRELLKSYMETSKLSRRAYLGELAQSRVVVSPFGLGEITLKDFEVFLAGATLLKPDMSHVETWPALFEAGQTMFSHRWDLSDLKAIIDEILDSPGRAVEIARNGQECYRRHVAGPESADIFAQYFTAIVRADMRGART